MRATAYCPTIHRRPAISRYQDAGAASRYPRPDPTLYFHQLKRVACFDRPHVDRTAPRDKPMDRETVDTLVLSHRLDRRGEKRLVCRSDCRTARNKFRECQKL